MRVAHLIESCAGGSARVVLALIEQQAKIEADDITLIYSPLRADDYFLEHLSRLNGVNCVPLRMKRAVGLHDAVSLVGLAQALRRFGPFDVLHAHSSKAGALGRLVARLFRPMRVVYTPHGFITAGRRPSRSVMAIERWLAGWCSRVVVVSEMEQRHASCDLRIRPHRLALVANGLTFQPLATRDRAREVMGYAPDELVFGFVGRLSAEKNPARLIEAFAPVAAQVPGAMLAIFGHGPEADRIHRRVSSLGISDRVRTWSGQEARAFMPGFDALVCSSDREGMPLVFIEALQSGVPIVSTPVGGTAECVIPGVTGMVATGFEPRHLAEAMKAMASFDARRRLSMADAAREHGLRFSAERMADGIAAVYRQVLTEHRQ